MKHKLSSSIVLITVVMAGIVIGLAIFAQWKITASPRSSFSFLIKALKANDIQAAKSVMTPDCVVRIEGFIREPGWEATALGLKAKAWHLEKSTSTWPILRRWAEVVDEKETSFSRGDSAEYQVTPIAEHSVTFEICRQSYGRWLMTDMYLEMGN